MAKRKKIGIVYSYNENWIGGTYYIQNLLQSFKVIEDRFKPRVIIFSSNINEYNALVKDTSYPYISHSYLQIPFLTIWERMINKLNKFLQRKTIKKTIPRVNLLFPASHEMLFNKKQKFLYWIPDFQEHYLPEFFSISELEGRKNWHKSIIKKANAAILFSSNTAFSNYKEIYPNANTTNYIVQFAVTHPNYGHQNIEELKLKYKIDGKFFISPNQFWKHKNHKVIIDAVKILKNAGVLVNVVFTGKPYDYRYPEYYEELVEYVRKAELIKSIKFLGFIDRTEQLQLMKFSQAIIQPSLFEGWSTVIEDAKAMNQFVVASNIPVHIEQINRNVLFFSPTNPVALANIIDEINKEKPSIVFNDYSINVKNFSEDFLRILNSN